MLKNLAFLLSLSVSFAAGYIFAPLVPVANRGEPVAVVELKPRPAKRFSIHKKSPLAESVHVRQAALPAPLPPQSVAPVVPRVAQPKPVTRPRTQLVAFASSPFPYDGMVPRRNKPFVNHEKDGRAAHKTGSGRIYWVDETYSDQRVLLHIPKGFDKSRPGVMVLFFHGHGATLERDVAARQRVPEQISESGVNAVLVAPQFAVDARDSSAGNFWKPEGIRRFLDETADKLAELGGSTMPRDIFTDMPIVIVGYSGGYVPTAWALHSRVMDKRLRGVVLLDGLYGEVSKFASWIARDKASFFLSAYTSSTRRGNAALRKKLAEKGIPHSKGVAPRLHPGSVTFVAADEEHRHYVTRAWSESPIADILNRMTGTSPRAPIAVSAALEPRLTQ